MVLAHGLGVAEGVLTVGTAAMAAGSGVTAAVAVAAGVWAVAVAVALTSRPRPPTWPRPTWPVNLVSVMTHERMLHASDFIIRLQQLVGRMEGLSQMLEPHHWWY